MNLTRREALIIAGAALAPSPGKASPAAKTVAVAKCPAYDNATVTTNLKTMFDQIGGLSKIVRNRTVTIKLNMTGGPRNKFQGMPLGDTHYVHPVVVYATAHLIGEAGARRIRFVESAALAGPLENYMEAAGWNVKELASTARTVEFENTNNLGFGKDYIRFKVPGEAFVFPAYDMNRSYHDTDVFVSLAKLKNHAICGVTLTLKNCFGNLPCSIYGGQAGVDAPNENAGGNRAVPMHFGRRAPSKSSPQELDPNSPRDPGYRMPRIVAELTAARPIDLAIIDGITSISGGEGPWIGGVRAVQPGVLIAGTNPVNTDAVAAAIMGYDPRAAKGAPGFPTCDNTMTLAERLGSGSTDLGRIEVAGVPIAKALYRYDRA